MAWTLKNIFGSKPAASPAPASQPAPPRDLKPPAADTQPPGTPQAYSVRQLNRYGTNYSARCTAPYGASGDYAFESEADYYGIMEVCRLYDRNHPLVGQMVDRLVANILQDGFKVNPQTGDEELDKYLADRWEEEAADPNVIDVAGENTWTDLERLACRASIVDGDCAMLGTTGGFQLFEGHNIKKVKVNADERIFLGVELDSVRRRVAYYLESVAPDRLEGAMPENDPKRHPTLIEDEANMPILFPSGNKKRTIRQVMHVYDPKRSSLTRGVSNLYPYITPLGLIMDIDEATLVSLQTGTCFVIFRKQPLDPAAEVDPEGSHGQVTYEPVKPGYYQRTDNIVPGTEVVGNPGEEFDAFSPKVPTTNYLEFRLQQIANVAAGLDLALEGVTLDFREANFVGFRGAEHEAKKGQRRRQENLKQRLHKPAYQYRVAQWLQDDPVVIEAAANPELDIFRHDWTLPKVDYVEPVNDAKGDVIRGQNSLTSRRRISGERGEKWSEVLREIVDDNFEILDYAAERARELNGKYPELETPISVHQLAPLPTADGVQVNATPMPDQSTETADV